MIVIHVNPDLQRAFTDPGARLLADAVIYSSWSDEANGRLRRVLHGLVGARSGAADELEFYGVPT